MEQTRDDAMEAKNETCLDVRQAQPAKGEK